MITGRTFNILQYMHTNVGNKNVQTNDLFVSSLRVKDQINEF